ncbi:glycosyltransferase family 4 protein [soil metagenome]
MNVLYLSYDGMTDPLGQSQVLPYLTGLASEHSITIISFEKRERSQVNTVIQEIVRKSNIEWIPLEYHKRPAIISTLRDVYAMWQTALSIVKKRPIHLVHCRSYITALVGLRLKKRLGIPFLFDMRGFWADERVEGGLWNVNNPVYKTIYNRFKRWEKEFVKNADSIVTLTQCGKKEVASWKLNDQIVVIPCCVDENLFDPLKIDTDEKKELRIALGINEKDFILIYVGSLSTWYLLDDMMRFYSVLREKVASPKFLILTSEQIDFSRWGWNREIITQFVPRDKMPLYISLANASVFFVKPSYSKKGSSATKMAELMAMNIPFVTNSGWGDVEEILSQGGGGLLLSQLNESAFNKAVTELTTYRLPPSRSVVKNYFSLSSGIKLYSQLYGSIGKKNFR